MRFLAIVLIIGLLLAVVFLGNKRQENCKSLGGVVVHTYAAVNCWKDGGYIDF